MTDTYGAYDATPHRSSPTSSDTVEYPTDHVLAIVPAGIALRRVLDALTSGGFAESEITVLCGAAEADRLASGTGRTGLLDRVLRIAERIGVRNHEIAVKDRYEEALRRGQYVVEVHASTDERKDRAAALLAHHGAHFVNHFGRVTIERLAA